MPARGRRSPKVDTRPGQVMLLGALANAPVLLGFVLAPLVAGRDAPMIAWFIPIVTWATPVLAGWGLFIFSRAGDARAHRGARIGLILCMVAMLFWALVVLAPERPG